MCAWLYDGRNQTMTPTHPLTLTQVGTRLKPGDPDPHPHPQLPLTLTLTLTPTPSP